MTHTEEPGARIDDGSLTPPSEGGPAPWSSTPPRWEGIDVAACSRYILGRQTIDGGFCFYVYHDWGVEEANAPDTYAAVASLGLLDRPVPRRTAVTDWLKAKQDRYGGFPNLTIAHATLNALRLLGEKPLRDPDQFLEETAQTCGLMEPAGREPSGWLYNAVRCVQLWRDHGLVPPERMRARIAAVLACLRARNGGYGRPGTSLSDTANAVVLAKTLRLPIDPGALQYVRRCEGAPHGFNITPGALSSGLETHRAGLQVLCRFAAAPMEPALVRRYIAACQTPRGGFGRVPGAVPRLDDTLWALQALSMLSDAPPQAREAPQVASSGCRPP